MQESNELNFLRTRKLNHEIAYGQERLLSAAEMFKSTRKAYEKLLIQSSVLRSPYLYRDFRKTKQQLVELRSKKSKLTSILHAVQRELQAFGLLDEMNKMKVEENKKKSEVVNNDKLLSDHFKSVQARGAGFNFCKYSDSKTKVNNASYGTREDSGGREKVVSLPRLEPGASMESVKDPTLFVKLSGNSDNSSKPLSGSEKASSPALKQNFSYSPVSKTKMDSLDNKSPVAAMSPVRLPKKSILKTGFATQSKLSDGSLARVENSPVKVETFSVEAKKNPSDSKESPGKKKKSPSLEGTDPKK